MSLNFSRSFICYKCGIESSGLGTECNVCYAAGAHKQYSERLEYDRIVGQQAQALQQQYYIEQQQREGRLHQQRLEEEQALYNREQLDLQRLAVEANLSSDDIYNYGLHYIDGDYTDLNPQLLEITVKESGEFTGSWHSSYELPHLRQAFNRGLTEALDEYLPVDEEVLLNAAYYAGRRVAAGVLDPTFNLNSGVTIGGRTVHTRFFNSNFKSTVDETTGRWDCSWNPPFESERLNDRFADGILEIDDLRNSQEGIDYRLQVEIPRARAQLEQARQELEQGNRKQSWWQWWSKS